MLRVNSFELSGYTSGPGLPDVSENERIAELRTVIREAIARGIDLVLERDRFSRRIVDIIAESSGFPSVAAYLREDGSSQMSLAAGTDDAPVWLPRRLETSGFPTVAATVVETMRVHVAIETDAGQYTAVIPLNVGLDTIGFILLLNVRPESLSPEDLQALDVVAEEIAPALRVAIHHHQIRQSSVVDIPTGAYTYDFFLQRLEEELSRSRRTGHAVTIVLMEFWHIEHFEAAAGYEPADRLLRELASGVAALMRASDVVARRRRTGFALLLPESDVEGADLTIARIHERLRRIEAAFDESGYSGPQPTVVAGASTFPADGQNAAELILAADQRMLAEADELEIAAR